MILSFSNCQRTYFLIWSSSRPTVLTQYPLAQKCLPQYRFFNSKCLSNSLIALFPFRKPTTSDIEYLGILGGILIVVLVVSILILIASDVKTELEIRNEIAHNGVKDYCGNYLLQHGYKNIKFKEIEGNYNDYIFCTMKTKQSMIKLRLIYHFDKREVELVDYKEI